MNRGNTGGRVRGANTKKEQEEEQGGIQEANLWMIRFTAAKTRRRSLQHIRRLC